MAESSNKNFRHVSAVACDLLSHVAYLYFPVALPSQAPPFFCDKDKCGCIPPCYRYDSVTGTENDQDVIPVRISAQQDKMAAKLLAEGSKYGKQFAIYASNLAYPAYIVSYTLDERPKMQRAEPTAPPVCVGGCVWR